MVEAGTSNHAIEIDLKRAVKHRGILITVRVWPEVETFFEQWSGGLQERPSHGRLWHPIVATDPLNLWSLGIPNLGPNSSKPFSLLHGGANLITDGGFPNISFIRLVGASREEGQSCVVEAVMSQSELAQIGQRISEACHLFYSEYLQPINIKAFVGVYRLPAAA
jgi:hypothetical protein